MFVQQLDYAKHTVPTYSGKDQEELANKQDYLTVNKAQQNKNFIVPLDLKPFKKNRETKLNLSSYTLLDRGVELAES